MKNFIKGFWQIADPKIWIGSAVPLCFGAVLAFTTEHKFSLIWFLLASIGIFLIEIGKNAINEIVDYLSGADTGVDEEHKTPFSGGKKTITEGIFGIKENIIVAIITLFPAAGIGLLVVAFKEFNVLYVGIIGLFLSIIYSVPPFKLCYRGLGELAVGINFGPLMVSGIYLTMAGSLNNFVLIASLPIGFLIANVLWINEFPDYEADKAVDKKNLVVRLGKERAVWGYAIIFILAYLSIIYIAFYTNNFIWLIGLFTLPLSFRAVKNCKKNVNDIKKLTLSNGLTIQIYLLTGILLSISAFLSNGGK